MDETNIIAAYTVLQGLAEEARDYIRVFNHSLWDHERMTFDEARGRAAYAERLLPQLHTAMRALGDVEMPERERGVPNMPPKSWRERAEREGREL